MARGEAGRVAIIGGGLGGLATALRLACHGWRVTVFERHATLGGKMNRLERGGYRFDTGPSLITMPWAFRETFEAAGERMEDYLDLVRVRPLCSYLFDDGERFEMSSSLPELRAGIARLEGGDASGFLRFLAMGASVLDLSRATFFQRSPWEAPRASEVGALRRPLSPAVLRPYRRVVASACRDPRVRQLLDRYTTYVGSDPARTPAMLSVIPAVELLEGGWHVRGGLYRVAEALVWLCERRGVELRTCAHVGRIRTDGRRVQGVELASGEAHDAEVVVMNGDSERLPALLGQSTERSEPPASRSLSGLVMLFGVPRRLEGWPHHQVLFSADYAKEFRDLFDERRFPEDPTVYVNTPTRTDPAMAPDGCECVFVMANAPASEAASWSDAEQAAAVERVERRLERAGLLGALRDAEVRVVLTPRWLRETFDMPGGAIYGAASHGARGAFLRPPNRDRRFHGLYRVGGSTHPGGGTPTVLLSARIACDLIERHERR